MQGIQFEIWRSREDHQWYWHVGSVGNGRILARSTDGYVNRSDCLHCISLVRANSISARVYDRDTEKFLTTH